MAALLTWLADNGALNDALFARLYARSKWVGNLTAPAKIKKVGRGVADVGLVDPGGSWRWLWACGR